MTSTEVSPAVPTPPTAQPLDSATSPSMRTWGNWHYHPETQELVYSAAHANAYAVDLDRCKTCSEILDWIMHLDGKRWTTAEDVGDLVRAFRTLLNPQHRS